MANLNLNNNTSNVIGNVKNLVANVVNQPIVRPTGQNPTTGINGFVFDIVAEEEISLDNEITDHYVENNYSIQDHIAQKPLRFTVRGYVGEIVDIFPNTLLSVLTAVQSLNSIGLFFPAFSSQATQVYAKAAGLASQAGNYINQAKNIYALLNNASTTATKQQKAYQTFSNFRENNQLCSIETPFGIFYNMAIERVTAVQGELTRYVSDFNITFKQIRTVSTQIIFPILNNPAGSGSVSPSNYGLPGSPVSAVPLLTQSQQNLASNAIGRVSQMTDPKNVLGQLQGKTSSVGSLLTYFPTLTPAQ